RGDRARQHEHLVAGTGDVAHAQSAKVEKVEDDRSLLDLQALSFPRIDLSCHHHGIAVEQRPAQTEEKPAVGSDRHPFYVEPVLLARKLEEGSEEFILRQCLAQASPAGKRENFAE